jgi:hypothetical protein
MANALLEPATDNDTTAIIMRTQMTLRRRALLFVNMVIRGALPGSCVPTKRARAGPPWGTPADRG